MLVNAQKEGAESAAQMIALDKGGFAIGQASFRKPASPMAAQKDEVITRTYDSAGADASGCAAMVTNDGADTDPDLNNGAFFMTPISGGFGVTYIDYDAVDDANYHAAQIFDNSGVQQVGEVEQNPAFLFLIGQTALSNGNVLTV